MAHISACDKGREEQDGYATADSASTGSQTGDALAPGEQQAAFDDAAESFPQQEGRHDHAGEPQAGGDLSCSEPAAAVLSPEERHAQLDKAEALKAAGNTLYSSGDYEAAIAKYQEAVGTAPADAPQRAVFLSNMAACHLKLAQHSQAVQACSDALDIDGASVKALMRRSTAFEALDDPEQALADARRVLELDTGSTWATDAVARLQPVVAQKQEKLKEEMLGKLKDLGNMVLGKFGLCCDNFKLDKDPNSGGYSIRFER